MKKEYARKSRWDYSKLKGRTAERGVTDADVARAGNMSNSTYSLKLNGKGDFSQEQIGDICVFLGIDFCEVHLYFFTPKV